MATWTELPTDKLFAQPDQAAFLAARRLRWCVSCKEQYSVSPPEILACPKCQQRGIRMFDRLTIIAGRRWGKSKMGSIAGTEEATIPNTIGWACAPTNPKLQRYVIPAFQQLIPRSIVQSWNSEFLDLRLKNGSLIHFQTLEDPDQGRGQGLDWLWIDEVCELTKSHWDVIRPSLGDKQGVAFFTTSPRSYDWVYSELYRPAEDGFVITPDGKKKDVFGYWGLHAKTSDNPLFQTTQGKAYLAREKESMSDEMYRQEFEADFVSFTGAVYGSLLESQILRTDAAVKELIPEWPDIAAWRQILVGLDSGADHPFGAVKLVATDRGFLVIGEYLERHRTFVQHATEIKRLAGSASTQWAINRNERQATIELGQHGMYCKPANNDVVAGTERVKSWLHQKQLWFVESRCPKTIQQMKSYRWAESETAKGEIRPKEKVFKKDDELPDCVRYALMTWPVLPKPTPVEKKRDLSVLPPSMRQAIERERRLDTEVKPLKDFTGDFWQ